MTAALIEAGDLGTWTVLGEQFLPLATGTQTGGAYEFFEVTARQGEGPPPHRHAWDEAYLVLEGQLSVAVGDMSAWMLAGPRSYVRVPGGTLHSYRVASETVRFITFTTPAGAGRFFAEMSQNVREMPQDAPLIGEVASRNGVEIVLPA